MTIRAAQRTGKNISVDISVGGCITDMVISSCITELTLLIYLIHRFQYVILWSCTFHLPVPKPLPRDGHLWSHWDPLPLVGVASAMKRCLELAANDDAGATGMWFEWRGLPPQHNYHGWKHYKQGWLKKNICGLQFQHDNSKTYSLEQSGKVFEFLEKTNARENSVKRPW